MAACGAWPCVPGLPGYRGPTCDAALPRYAAALHRAAGLADPPYDPVRIAEALGVRVQAVPTYEGTRGVLVPLRDGAYRILVRTTETPGAQRFTVAHELVELGLQIGCPALVERSYHDVGAGRAKERFCEAGAAAILLPLDRVRAELAVAAPASPPCRRWPRCSAPRCTPRCAAWSRPRLCPVRG